MPMVCTVCTLPQLRFTVHFSSYFFRSFLGKADFRMGERSRKVEQISQYFRRKDNSHIQAAYIYTFVSDVLKITLRYLLNSYLRDHTWTRSIVAMYTHSKAIQTIFPNNLRSIGLGYSNKTVNCQLTIKLFWSAPHHRRNCDILWDDNSQCWTMDDHEPTAFEWTTRPTDTYTLRNPLIACYICSYY